MTDEERISDLENELNILKLTVKTILTVVGVLADEHKAKQEQENNGDS